jgi:hypothetical protein
MDSRYFAISTRNNWKKCSALFILALTLCACSQVWAAYGKYWDSGPDNMRIVIAITGDGYTINDQTQFSTDALAVANAILTTSPWSTFANSINIYIISAFSSESGADKPWLSQYVNTIFDGTYGTNGIQHCLTVDYSKVTSFLSGAISKYDVVVVTVNDSLYGGSGHNAAVTSNNAAMTDIILHELGHTFANLEEEYEGNPTSYIGPEPTNPNVTTVTNPLLIKWKAWIDPATPIPTPIATLYLKDVGLYEGAFTYSFGIYRPMQDCRMRNIGSDFCPVCKEAHIMQAHSIAPLIDGVSPGPGTFTMPEPTTFEALGNGWQYLTKTWKLDGVQIETGTYAIIHPGALSSPSSTLTLDVLDDSPMIKSYSLPSQQYQWTLTPDIETFNNITDLREGPYGIYCKMDGVVSAVFGDCFYVQNSNRTAAVRVNPWDGTFPTLGKTVTLCGIRDSSDWNLTLGNCYWAHHTGNPDPPEPLAVNNKALGGGDINSLRGCDNCVGLNNVGLLVRTFGHVETIGPDGLWITIDDGSSRTDVDGNIGVRVYGTNMSQYAGKYLCVTGICFIDEVNPANYAASIRTRDQNDISAYTP